LINVTNTFDGNIIKENGKLKTTRENKVEHGFGLSSVSKIVKKYNGTINTSYTEKLFSAKVLLYNTPAESSF